MSKEHASESAVSRGQFIKGDEMGEEKEAPKRVSRRQFVKGAAVGAAGAAAGAAVSCAPAATPAPTAAPVPAATAVPAAAPSSVPEKWDYDVDVVVVGAGNGGMTALLAAADGGAKALLIEVSGHLGGSTLFSGGNLHSESRRTWEAYNTRTHGEHGQGDPVLSRTYVETMWQEYIPWLLSKNAYISKSDLFDTVPPPAFGEGDYKLGKGEPGCLGKSLYFENLAEQAKALGATILLKTRAIKLHADDQGSVIGVMARVWSNSPVEADQEMINIKAKKTILAAGNFYGNREMKTKYLGPDADKATCFGGPYQTGEGIAMGQAVGAMLSGSMSGFAGVTCAVTPTRQLADDPEAYEKMFDEYRLEDLATNGPPYDVGRPWPPYNFTTESKGANVILVNLNGKRFYDESMSSDLSNLRRQIFAVLEQPHGFAWLIADQDAYDAPPGAEVADAMIKAIVEEGGKVIRANSLEELAAGLEVEGMYKANFLKTIAEYNDAIDNGTTAELDPPRSQQEKYWRISRPAFYAIPVTASIYTTYGGLAINEDAQTLDMQRRPIPNLYSPPPCGGGIMRYEYMGGIALAGVFGFRAGRHAAANL